MQDAVVAEPEPDAPTCHMHMVLQQIKCINNASLVLQREGDRQPAGTPEVTCVKDPAASALKKKHRSTLCIQQGV